MNTYKLLAMLSILHVYISKFMSIKRLNCTDLSVSFLYDVWHVCDTMGLIFNAKDVYSIIASI